MRAVPGLRVQTKFRDILPHNGSAQRAATADDIGRTCLGKNGRWPAQLRGRVVRDDITQNKDTSEIVYSMGFIIQETNAFYPRNKLVQGTQETKRFREDNKRFREDTMTTRRSFLLAGLGSLTTVAVGSRRRAHAGLALQKVNVVIPRNSVFILNYMGGKDAGVFTKFGIDLDVDARPFAGFLAGLPSKQCMAVTYSGMDAIQKINEGVDWAIIGGGLTVVQEVLVRTDSPFKTVADLRGKKFGTFSTGAGSFKAARVAIIDAFGLDVVKDTQLQQLAAPALFKLLENGQVDAMINISSFTLAASSQPDKFRSIFAPDQYWRDKTGYPIAWAAPIVAWKSWIDEDPNRAKNFAAAIEESFRWLRRPENLDAAVKSHGELAGVTKSAEIAEYKKWLAAKHMFLTEWDRKAVDAQWKFLELAEKTGILSKVPPEGKYALLLEAERRTR